MATDKDDIKRIPLTPDDGKYYQAVCNGKEGFAFRKDDKWIFKPEDEDRFYPCEENELEIGSLIPTP